MKILVLYFSQSGNTRLTAEAIAEAARNNRHQASVKSMGEVTKADVDAADVLFIGTWVQGYILFGVKPARADLWVPNLPPLNGKPVGVFCTYAFNPRSSLKALANKLKDRGAIPVSQRAFHRSRLTDGVDMFVQHALESARTARV